MHLKKRRDVEHPVATQDHTETLIAPGIHIKGKIDGQDKVRIAGHFEGSILCESMVSIEKKGKVKGTIDARSIIIEGEINGNIDSAEQVDIKPEGRLIGNVKAANFTLAPKSVFDGQATIPRKAIEMLILSRNGRVKKLDL